MLPCEGSTLRLGFNTPSEQTVAAASLRDCTPFVPHFVGPCGETLNYLIRPVYIMLLLIIIEVTLILRR